MLQTNCIDLISKFKKNRSNAANQNRGCPDWTDIFQMRQNSLNFTLEAMMKDQSEQKMINLTQNKNGLMNIKDLRISTRIHSGKSSDFMGQQRVQSSKVKRLRYLNQDRHEFQFNTLMGGNDFESTEVQSFEKNPKCETSYDQHNSIKHRFHV